MAVGVLGFPLESSLSRFQFIVISGVVGALVTVIIQTIVVLSKLKQKGESVVNPLLNLLPFLIFLPSCFMWCLYSDIALSAYPIASLLLISSTFTEMVSHIMLMHICDDPLSPWGRITSFLIAILPIHVFLTKSMTSSDGWILQTLLSKVSEAYLLQALAVFSFFVTSTKLYLVSGKLHRSDRKGYVLKDCILSSSHILQSNCPTTYSMTFISNLFFLIFYHIFCRCAQKLLMFCT